MSTLLTGISELWTLDPARDDAAGRAGSVGAAVPAGATGATSSAGATADQVVHDGALVIEDGRIAWTGAATEAPAADERVDLGGRAVLPGWVDSHTHLVFAGDRSAEFEARMAGQAYAAGGIQVTTDATRAASDAELAELVRGRIGEARRGGTTTLETKTGYGLTVEDEARAAALAAELVAAGELDEVTFLGAHLVPPEFREGSGAAGADATTGADAYVDLVVGDMLAAVARAGGSALRWIDVFCEEGAFETARSRRVLEAGRAAGLGLRIHGNQMGTSQQGVQLACELGAASVDHLNFLDTADVEALAGTASRPVREDGRTPGHLAVDAGPTVATVLPACDLSTRAPLAPARDLLDAGAELAIASNCNPGTSYTSAMTFCVATAVLQMHLSLAEAIRAATRGGALALRRSDVGHLGVGARADLHVLDAPAAIHLAYRPGMPLTHSVWRAGERIV